MALLVELLELRQGVLEETADGELLIRGGVGDLEGLVEALTRIVMGRPIEGEGGSGQGDTGDEQGRTRFME